MRKIGLISVIALLLGWMSVHTSIAADSDSRPGYKVLENPHPTANPDKIEMLEFFAYTCGHCYNFETGYLSKWTPPDDVEFIKIPLAFGSGLQYMIRGYYTADAMGIGPEFQKAIFRAFKKERKRFNSVESVADFATQFGVSKKDFLGTYNSFAVEVKVNTGEQLAKEYGIHGVPTVIINGKYQTSGAIANGFKDAMEKIDMLIKKERALMNASAKDDGVEADVDRNSKTDKTEQTKITEDK